LLVCICAAALILVSPAVEQLLAVPPTTRYSELGMLGPNRTAENYPADIQSGTSYSVFLDVGNHLGHTAYYMILVKLMNETQFAAGTDAPSLFNFTGFVADKQTWEIPIMFSIDFTGVVEGEIFTQANVTSVTVNGETVSPEGYRASWNPDSRGFLGNVVFELWIYNDSAASFQNHERSVNLHLNLTP
jgi:hypothetical protein